MSKFDEFVAEPSRRRLYEQDALAFDATELICSLMQRQEVSKADLAKRLGKSKSFVTQLLSGSRNMTLHTFADVLFALGHVAELKPVPIMRNVTSASFAFDMSEDKFLDFVQTSRRNQSAKQVQAILEIGCTGEDPEEFNQSGA